jgi:hypothetical protein
MINIKGPIVPSSSIHQDNLVINTQQQNTFDAFERQLASILRNKEHILLDQLLNPTSHKQYPLIPKFQY